MAFVFLLKPNIVRVETLKHSTTKSLPSLSEWVQDIFAKCDYGYGGNRDKTISYAEFIKGPCKDMVDKKGLRPISKATVTIDLQLVFEAIDTDGDGELTQTEFITAHVNTKRLAPYFGKRVTCA